MGRSEEYLSVRFFLPDDFLVMVGRFYRSAAISGLTEAGVTPLEVFSKRKTPVLVLPTIPLARILKASLQLRTGAKGISGEVTGPNDSAASATHGRHFPQKRRERKRILPTFVMRNRLFRFSASFR